MNCDKCLLVESLKAKIEVQQCEIDIMNRETDDVIAIFDLLLTIIEVRLRDCNLPTGWRGAAIEAANTIEQVSATFRRHRQAGVTGSPPGEEK